MNILIVEDDSIITDALTLILKGRGYNSFQASDINSALNEMKYSTVDGVILDLNLPDGDGTRLVRLIKKSIFLSQFWLSRAIALLTSV